MITPESRLSILRLPLNCLQVSEYQDRYPDRLDHYIRLLKEHPGDYPGLVCVEPSKTHTGMFNLLDGHHRFAASIIAGRADLLCVVVEELQGGQD